MQSSVARELDEAVDAARHLAAPTAASLTDFVARAATRTCRTAGTGRRCAGVPHDGRDPSRARSRARRRRARVRRGHRRRGRGQRVRPDAWPARPLRRSCPRHADLRERDRRARRRRRDGRNAPGGRADVPRLPRRLSRPVAQPGREAAVHDRRRRADGAHRADPVRRGPLVGKPALAEPRGAARAHPRPERRHAVDPGRHLRAAARRDPGPEPGRLHREPVALRHEGTAAAGRPHPPDRPVRRRARRAPTSRSCRSHGWCTRRSPRPRTSPAKASPSR